MKLSWPRPVTTQLRMPQVCAVTGQPATQLMPMVFRNRYSHWLPGIGRVIMNLTSPFVVMPVPVSDAVKKRVITWRLISLGTVLGGLALGILLAVALRNAAGGGLFFLLLVVGVVGSIVARLRADVIGSDVNGDVISMRTAHPAFVQAVLATNPPGMLSVESGAVEEVAPQQTWGQAPPQPQYAQTFYAQPGYQPQDPQTGHQPQYPQAPYPHAPYPQAPYPQAQQPQYPQAQSWPNGSAHR